MGMKSYIVTWTDEQGPKQSVYSSAADAYRFAYTLARQGFEPTVTKQEMD
jgi:hypothetical protein